VSRTVTSSLMIAFFVSVATLLGGGGCPANMPPTVMFDASPKMGNVPLTVNFQDESMTGGTPIVSWNWEFGDGGTSTQQNPAHIYDEAGTFDVTLTVTDEADQTASFTEEDFIVAGQETRLVMERIFPADGVYLPGETIEVTLRFEKAGDDPITAFGAEEILPDDWTFLGLVRNGEGEDAGLPDNVTQPTFEGESGPNVLELAWFQVPDFPIEFTYQMDVPDDESDPRQFTGFGLFRVEAGEEQQTNVVDDEASPIGGTGDFSEDMVISRRVSNNGRYTPGAIFEVTIRFDYTGPDSVQAFGLQEQVPKGWTFQGITTECMQRPGVALKVNATGTLDFAWISIPRFPVEFTYQLQVPAGETGLKTFGGRGNFRTTGAPGALLTNIAETTVQPEQ